MTARLTIADIRGRATITIPAAGQILGLGRDSAYRAADRGEIPTLKLGRRLLVPVPKLLRLLGELDPEDSEAPVATRGARQETIHDQADRYRHDHPPAA
jgi:hypothetical protein